MEKKVCFVKNSIKGLLLIGMSVQIALGLSWMCGNLFSVQDFAETAEYLEMSRTFLLDEYVGVLYPLLLRLCPVYPLVYLLQAAAAFLSGCAFLSFTGLGKERLFAPGNLFGGAYLVTIPFVMQLHMAILPQSLTFSLFLLQMGLCMRVLRGRTGRYLCSAAVCCLLWAGEALLMPDYLWLGGVPAVWLFAACLGRIRLRKAGTDAVPTGVRRENVKKTAGLMLACMAGTVVLVLSVNSLTQTPGSRGNIQRTLGAAMVSRLVWPDFVSNYYFWPGEVKEVMSQSKGHEISQYADNVKTVLGPLFEEAFGREQANAYYWEMAIRCLSDRTKEVLARIGEDFVSYLFAPFSVGYQLSGGGVSYSGWNYDRMWEHAKVLTGWYVRYGTASFAVGIIPVLLLSLVRAAKRRKRRISMGGRACFLFAVCCVLSQTLWYTMSGTYMMDYKNVPAVMALWYVCILWGFGQYGGRTDEDGKKE